MFYKDLATFGLVGPSNEFLQEKFSNQNRIGVTFEKLRKEGSQEKTEHYRHDCLRNCCVRYGI